MYAIIETGGKQYWVTPGEILQVEKLEEKKGAEVELKALWSASGEAQAGNSKLPGAKVKATIVRHLRAPKVIVYKRRPKKAYESLNGHRQYLTEIQIKDIQLV